MVEVKINPEYRALVPRPTPDEYKSLEADIIAHGGALEPIKINSKGEILDGYTRFEITTKHDLPYETKVLDFPTVEDEKLYIINANLLRRHLNTFQKIELAIPLAEIIARKAKQRQSDGGKLGVAVREERVAQNNATLPETGKTTEKVAKQLHMSASTFEKGKAIIEKGTEEEKTKARSGKQSVSATYNKMKKRQEAESLPPAPPKEKTKKTIMPIEINYLLNDLKDTTGMSLEIKPEHVQHIGLKKWNEQVVSKIDECITALQDLKAKYQVQATEPAPEIQETPDALTEFLK